jgi:NAD(P)-dependent dehydrogenase (short-subunit alcohol dehydrogenase family)
MHIKELFNIQGRVAVVTGGSGLYGRCIVEGLCEAEAKVIIASRNLEKCEETASFYREQGYKAYAYSLDLASHESVISFTEKVWQDFGQVDILVNNSVLRPMKGYDDDLSAWRKSLDVNATGLLDITRCFAEKMIPQKRGSIINISSMYGLVGPDYTNYEGTDMGDLIAPDYWFNKAGMINLTRYFAARLGPHNIRVNTVSPGGLFNNQPKLFLERYAKRVFLGRMANQDDVKGVVVFLASDASAYITGENIVMDGGYTCK